MYGSHITPRYTWAQPLIWRNKGIASHWVNPVLVFTGLILSLFPGQGFVLGKANYILPWLSLSPAVLTLSGQWQALGETSTGNRHLLAGKTVETIQQHLFSGVPWHLISLCFNWLRKYNTHLLIKIWKLDKIEWMGATSVSEYLGFSSILFFLTKYMLSWVI